MGFQKGHKLAKGGARPGAGRKSKQELEAIASAEKVFRKVLEGKVEPIANHYARRVFKSDQVLLDARKKLWPDELDGEQSPGDVYIQFNFGIIPPAKPDILHGLDNGNGRNFDGRTLYLGSDESGGE